MDVTRTEEEQIEALKKWWSENGWYIVAGIIIGLTAVFGWRYWLEYQNRIAEQASDLYAGMVVDVRQKKFTEARTLADRILAEYPDTTYASFAALMLGKLDVTDNNLDNAQKHLQWVLDNSKQDELKHLARTRLARVLLAAGKDDAAMKLIDNIDHGEFAATYQEIKGDIYMHQNKTEEARKAYQLALSSSIAGGKPKPFLEMKIENLGR